MFEGDGGGGGGRRRRFNGGGGVGERLRVVIGVEERGLEKGTPATLSTGLRHPSSTLEHCAGKRGFECDTFRHR